jgi:hypothetical protein
MTTNATIVNQVPFLRTTRNFPEEIQPLTEELNRSYVDIAAKVNARTIGLFPTNKPAITGEAWFYNANEKQQTLRQLYTFTSAGSIAHGINLSQIAGISRIFGTFTDATNWYPLPYVDVVSATNQVNVIITPTNIVIAAGGGTPPSITSGFVVVEWLSLF